MARPKRVDKLAAVLSHELFVKEFWAKGPVRFEIGEDFLREASKLPNSEKLIATQASKQPEAVGFIEKGRKYYLNRVPEEDRTEAVKLLSPRYALALYHINSNNDFYHELGSRLLQRFRAEECLIAAYVSFNKKTGLKKHKDEYHVFAFQHLGESRWRIFDRKKGNRLVREILLKPGSVLYVPAGYFHRVVRESDETVHVSIGLRYRTLDQELRALRKAPVFDCLFGPGQKKLPAKELNRQLDCRFHLSEIHNARLYKTRRLGKSIL